MSEIRRGFLRKRGGKFRPVRLLELAVLLYQANAAYQDPDVGFEDTNNSIDALTKRLNWWVLVDPAQIESLLWACNMLNEKSKFSHPRGLTFEQFLEKILRGKHKFDSFYGIIEWKDKKKDEQPTEENNHDDIVGPT